MVSFRVDGAGGPAGLQLAHLQHRIERVAAIDRLQEARGLLEEADQRIADDVREDAGAGRALDRHLQAVGQHVAMAARLAVFAVVVDRMVVAAGQLEGSEQRLGLGAGVDVELLADLEVLEPVGRTEAMLGRIEGCSITCPPFHCRHLSSGSSRGFQIVGRVSSRGARPIAIVPVDRHADAPSRPARRPRSRRRTAFAPARFRVSARRRDRLPAAACRSRRFRRSRLIANGTPTRRAACRPSRSSSWSRPRAAAGIRFRTAGASGHGCNSVQRRSSSSPRRSGRPTSRAASRTSVSYGR